jgi:hypothetical protein
MFVLLQICPQAIGPDDLHDPIDVIGVDASRERLEQYLTAYRERHRVACALGRDRALCFPASHELEARRLP